MKTEDSNGSFVLRGGTVIDGTGSARFAADVRVTAGRIAEIGVALEARGDGELQIDVTGRIVCPGFIDVHTHDDQLVLGSPEMLPKISQGVTTVVVGNCGISLAPLVHDDVPPPLNLLGGRGKHIFPTMRAYAEAVDAARPAVNVAALVGHSTLRVAAMGDPYRQATPLEQARMVELTREAMAAGATGLSTGVFYAPGAAADVAEVVMIARVVGEAGGVYTTHIRDEAVHIIESLDEAFTAAAQARIPVVISHHKCSGPDNWGRSVETLAHIKAARAKQPIGLDAYPYIAGSTILRPEAVDGIIDIMVSWSVPFPEMSGRMLADIAHDWNCTQLEACARLQPGGAIYFQMREDDVRRVLQFEATMI
ncbi:MAG: amidohydrolase family protein, partial [Casimicrobiaceae bacterium]